LLKKRLLFITGSPGTGKTSVLLKTIETLKARGYSVGGMISREVRTYGARVGFEILDLNSGRRGQLAHVNQKYGPRIGKYRVNLKDLDNIGAEAIATAVENVDVVAIDEIGPMELHSERFKEAVKKAVESRRLVIGTVHWKVTDRLIEEIRTRDDTEIYKVTYENRGNLHEIIIENAAEFLAKATKK
jgi:nucleoside-triphosphatase